MCGSHAALPETLHASGGERRIKDFGSGGGPRTPRRPAGSGAYGSHRMRLALERFQAPPGGIGQVPGSGRRSR